jgi:hypothetical protein
MELRVARALSDIVHRVKSAGYQETHQLHVKPRTLDSTMWRMYQRPEENSLIQVAYVSDASDLLTRQTFAGSAVADTPKDAVQEAKLLEELLDNYVDGIARIEAASAIGWKHTLYVAGGGAVIGFAVGRLPEALMGGAIAAIAMQLPRGYRVLRAEHALESYLENHNIRTGNDAWEHLAIDVSPSPKGKE